MRAGDLGRLARRLLFGSLAVLLALSLTLPAQAVPCGGIALADGCLFTATGGDTSDPNDGFAVTNADGVAFWDFYQALDLQDAGYPISQRFQYAGFTTQAFQKVMLQWRPEQGRFNYLNTLDILANDYGINLPNVPEHQVLPGDERALWDQIVQNHLAILRPDGQVTYDYRRVFGVRNTHVKMKSGNPPLMYLCIRGYINDSRIRCGWSGQCKKLIQVVRVR